MRIPQISKPNPFNDCQEPMKGKPLPFAGSDAVAAATTFCAQAWAKVEEEHLSWQQLAVKLVVGTHDFREAVIKSFDAQLKQRRADLMAACGVEDGDKEGKKAVRANLASATVKVSELRSIAAGFNKQATLEGLLHAAGPGCSGLAGINPVNYRTILAYARSFLKSAAGRPRHPFLVKLGKALDSTLKPNDESSDLEVAQYAAVVALLNKLAEAEAKDTAPF